MIPSGQYLQLISLYKPRKNQRSPYDCPSASPAIVWQLPDLYIVATASPLSSSCIVSGSKTLTRHATTYHSAINLRAAHFTAINTPKLARWRLQRSPSPDTPSSPRSVFRKRRRMSTSSRTSRASSQSQAPIPAFLQQSKAGRYTTTSPINLQAQR